jgi:hypothetical protein
MADKNPMKGKFVLAESKNFEEYMKAIGVGLIWRKLGLTATPVTEVTIDNDQYQFKTTTTFKTNLLNFKLGEEFKEDTIDGRSCLSTVTKEAENKLKHVQKCGNDSLVSYRIFTEKGMEVVLESPGPNPIVCTRIYNRVE